MGKYQKNIEAARRITVMQYLETYHPGELVRKTDREYCTRTHDSLIITPANGFFHWFSRNVGGNNAIDYLTKVEGMDFVSAVSTRIRTIIHTSFINYKQGVIFYEKGIRNVVIAILSAGSYRCYTAG